MLNSVLMEKTHFSYGRWVGATLRGSVSLCVVTRVVRKYCSDSDPRVTARCETGDFMEIDSQSATLEAGVHRSH